MRSHGASWDPFISKLGNSIDAGYDDERTHQTSLATKQRGERPCADAKILLPTVIAVKSYGHNEGGSDGGALAFPIAVALGSTAVVRIA